MASFFGKLKSGSTTTSPSVGSSPSKKDPNANPPTPLEILLQNAGPLRNDGTDRFFGIENFGNTCYCNSIIQCLYFSAPFRDQIVAYPQRSTNESITAAAAKAVPRSRNDNNQLNGKGQKVLGPLPRGPNGAITTPQQPTSSKPEDKESPEYKKKVALAAGPVINMSYENSASYDMSESLFTSLKDVFEAMIAYQARIAVVSPVRLLEVLRKENEMFRSAMHQDAHEFFNLLLNTVFESMEAHERQAIANATREGDEASVESSEKPGIGNVSFPNMLPAPGRISATRSLRELFEGTLTSETRCLTCENVSHRDEAFLDLSVDLEQHSSVTSCLRRFSEEEMLCERNKFHCDNCGGLQEAEKRMKIKRLPKILALHLKRFKYTEDLQRLQKLFHKVVYPYYLRLFNTTDDAEDPDRLYALYAVVIHIGGGPYHGHYVSLVKTPDRGWMLFDDEMVEPVDRSFVRNFFGDKPGLACAYVLFYRETTTEEMEKEIKMESRRKTSTEAQAGLGIKTRESHELSRIHSAGSPNSMEPPSLFTSLDHAVTTPLAHSNGHIASPISPGLTNDERPTSPIMQNKKEKEKDKRNIFDFKRRETDGKANAEEDRKVTPNAQDKDIIPSNGASSLARFSRSRSLKFVSRGSKKDKTSGALLGATNEGSAIADDLPEQQRDSGERDQESAQPSKEFLTQPKTREKDKDKDRDKDKEKEKKNRFSLRKKSFGVLS